MPEQLEHVRQRFASVRPYLYGGLDLIDFVVQTFRAEEIERHVYGPRSVQVTVRVGDSAIVLEAGELPPHVTPTQASVYVYVEDVDAAYERALRAGAERIEEPADKPYGERNAGVRDPSGNTWWISTYTGRGR